MIIPIELRFKADKDSKTAFRTDKTIKSHDVNSVEFHISIDGLELTDNHTAKILSIFHSSKSQVNVDCEIVEGKIIYKPDTNLISRHEHVTNYVYVYNGNQALDVCEFLYVVDLSKIDETSLEVKEVYDQSYSDLLADFEQALNDYKDNLPQADSVRAEIDVVLNQFGVDSQAKLSQYDADAQQAIADNQTAFDLAESGRQDNYEQAETARNQASNQAVADWEQGADALLETVEGNESERVDAETTRKSSETTRVSNEIERESAEDVRQANELLREENYNQKVDTAIVEADVVSKVDNKVTELTPQINDLTAQLAETASLLKTEDLTVNVPSDYPTLQTAFDNVSSFFFAPGTKVYINIESGFKPKLGIILKERDYRFIELVSDDEIVEVHDDFKGNFISGSHCEFPIFSLLVDMRGKGITGIALHRSANATVSDGCGVKNAAYAGVFVNRLSRLYTHDGIFSGAGTYGMFVDHVGYVYARYVNLNDSGGSGLRATKGSIVEVANAEIKNATNIAILASEGTRVIGITDPTRRDKHIDVSGSGGDGIRVTNGSEFIGDKVIINDCGSNGVNCSDGSKVLMNKTTMNNVKVGAVVTQNSSLSIQSGEILNASDRGIYLTESSTLDAPSIKVGTPGVGVMLNHGCNGNVRNADLKNCRSAVRVAGGSILNADGVDGTGHTGTYAFYVYTGGIINASGALGDLRIEPNTITSDGIIFQ